jgi:hypothetical protein
MKISVAAICVALVACAPSARADMTARQIMHAYEASDQIWSVYIGLIVNGFEWANTDLKARGLTPLYCDDNKLKGDTLGQHAQVIIPYLGRYLAARPGNVDLPIGEVLLFALRESFPCSR